MTRRNPQTAWVYKFGGHIDAEGAICGVPEHVIRQHEDYLEKERETKETVARRYEDEDNDNAYYDWVRRGKPDE